MIKNILKRIWIQRRSNFWIFAELILVFILLASVIDTAYMFKKTEYQSMGYSLERVYAVEIGYDYDVSRNIPGSELEEMREKSFSEIVRRIGERPEVEKATCFFGTRPCVNDTRVERYQTDTLHRFTANIFFTDENYFDVFGVKMEEGRKGDWSMAGYPRNAVISRQLADSLYGGGNPLGKMFYDSNRDFMTYRVCGVSSPTKHIPFQRYEMYAYIPMERWMLTRNTPYIAVKVKEGKEGRFRTVFSGEMKDRLKIGPYYLKGIVSYGQMLEDFKMGEGFVRINRIALMLTLFFVFNVFLGVIGTFWVRTNLRRPEIGLRMSLGASRKTVMGELLAEGSLLLALASVPAVIILANMIYAGLPVTQWQDMSAGRVIAALLFTYLLLGGMVLLGIAYPARRAMRIIPADALHEE